MNALIGNHIRFIVEWGQWVSAGVFALVLLALWGVLRRHRLFLPRSWPSALATLLLLPLLLLSALVFARISVIKPGAEPILARLDVLQEALAPPLEFETVADGSRARLQDYRGDVVLVNLWATWCAPCRHEMPELDRLQRRFDENGLRVLAVSDEDRDVLRRFTAEHDPAYVTARVERFDWVDMGSERPVTFLIDREGVVRDVFTGPWDEAFFAANVEPYL